MFFSRDALDPLCTLFFMLAKFLQHRIPCCGTRERKVSGYSSHSK